MDYKTLVSLDNETRDALEKLSEKRKTNMSDTVAYLIQEESRQTQMQAISAQVLSSSRACEKNTELLIEMFNRLIYGLAAQAITPRFVQPDKYKEEK